ncbi:HAD family phosphatase [uncultured Mucilaginibacter sp.]|uniref:HAD family hydrolase n=1 Tax=uncultured Mucilaginibacter sp. TaxID=797541 RepID=UPI0025DCD7CA|nr:HAD family phosphatase [uncultured Mucilaginibacter sp.]
MISPMQNIKNIIFDYGNVIFSLDFAKSQEAWKELGIDNANDFYSHKIQDPVFTAFERGDIDAIGFRERIKEITRKPNLTDQQIDHAWNSLLVGIPQGNHELILNLKSKYRTFLLSNINEIHFDHIMKYLKDDFGFESNDHLFEKIYYSHLLGKRKPEAEIFEQVLMENNLDPAETLFIDDSPQHIEGAKKLGINTYLMTAPDTIKALFKNEVKS